MRLGCAGQLFCTAATGEGPAKDEVGAGMCAYPTLTGGCATTAVTGAITGAGSRLWVPGTPCTAGTSTGMRPGACTQRMIGTRMSSTSATNTPSCWLWRAFRARLLTVNGPFGVISREWCWQFVCSGVCAACCKPVMAAFSTVASTT